QRTYVPVRLYWSSDAAWDASDTQLWETSGSTPDFPNSALNSASSKTVTATVTIPSVAAGSYYVLAVVDPTNFHPETNENNNVAAYPVTVTSGPEAGRIAFSTDRDGS